MSTISSKKNSLGTQIKNARNGASLTQIQLAESIEITHRQIIKYEKDEVSPTVDTLLKIAKACHISPHELLPEESLIPAQK